MYKFLICTGNQLVLDEDVNTVWWAVANDWIPPDESNPIERTLRAAQAVSEFVTLLPARPATDDLMAHVLAKQGVDMRSSTYLARPATLSRPSLRRTFVPTEAMGRQWRMPYTVARYWKNKTGQVGKTTDYVFNVFRRFHQAKLPQRVNRYG